MTAQAPRDWRAQKRAAIDAAFATARPGEPRRYVSPSRRYEIEVVAWEPSHGWRYSSGTVRRAGDDEPVAVIRRNYGAFPFTWAEGHSTGHDYLVCGEDYQGQTVVELDSGERIDYLPDSAEPGSGFCWARHHLAPTGEVLIVDGCYWANPYELVAFDFSQPMGLPYVELYRWVGDLDVVDGFDEQGNLTWTFEQEVRASDGKPVADLTEAEDSEVLDDHGHYVPGVFATQTYRSQWRAGTPFESTRTTLITTVSD